MDWHLWKQNCMLKYKITAVRALKSSRLRYRNVDTFSLPIRITCQKKYLTYNGFVLKTYVAEKYTTHATMWCQLIKRKCLRLIKTNRIQPGQGSIQLHDDLPWLRKTAKVCEYVNGRGSWSQSSKRKNKIRTFIRNCF